MSQANAMKVKVILGTDIRRWRHSADSTNLSALRNFVTASFGIDQFWLQYEDDEGDRLTLSSPTDFDDALACALEEDRKSLKIYVIEGSIHSAHPKKQSQPPRTSPPPQQPQPQQKQPSPSPPPSHPQEHEWPQIQAAAIDFLHNADILKVLPDLHRRVFSELEAAKNTPCQSASEPWDSPAHIEKVIRKVLASEPKFAIITSHKLYQNYLHTMLPCLALKISRRLPFLMGLTADCLSSWIPHLAAVLGHALRGFDIAQGMDCSMAAMTSSFLPLMCSFMAQQQQPARRSKNYAHRGVSCDGCGAQPIRGTRFKCAVCSDFDLCAHCEALGKHPANHPMMALYGAVSEAVRPFLGIREVIGRHGGPHGHGGRWGGRGRWGRGRHGNGGFGGWWAQGPPPPFGPHGCPPGPPPPFNGGWGANGQAPQGCQGQNGQGRGGWGAKRWRNDDVQSEAKSQNECGQSQTDASSAMVNSQKKQCSKVMADFVCDVTLPDRTYYPTDTVLTKTWRMRNSGEHAWGDGVSLVFFKGCESLTLEKRYPVKNARAGEEVEVSAVLKTPNKKGRYCSYYRLQRNGEFFGPRVWVDIFAVDEPEKVSKVEKVKKVKKEKVEKKVEESEAVDGVDMVLVDEEQLLDDIAAMAVQEMEAQEQGQGQSGAPMVSNIVVPPTETVFVYQAQLDVLKGMGFTNEEMIKAELVQQKGNVQRVANRLLQQQ